METSLRTPDKPTDKKNKEVFSANMLCHIIPVVVRSLAATLTKHYKVGVVVSSSIKAEIQPQYNSSNRYRCDPAATKMRDCRLIHRL